MIARELAAWALELQDAPQSVRHSAQRHLLDGVGTAVAGVRLAAAVPAVSVAQGLGGPSESTIIGTSLRVSAPAAALANGTLVHALDFDDTHAGGLVHATSVVLPAAFGVGELVGATGDEILLASIVGYEAVCRIAAAAPHGFHARGLHATMVAGVLSSSLVAARLHGLTLEQTTHALGIAGSQAGGLLAFLATDASTKQLHPGFASQAGIQAARLAAAGATGPQTVFDGPHGLFDALATGTVDKESILAGLGERWETLRIGIKPYPACQLSHASLDALDNALQQGDFTFDEIEHITAYVHPDSASIVCDQSRDLTRPASQYAAKFSLPWSLAALAIDREMSLDTFTSENITREEITRLAERVEIILAPTDGFASDAPGEVHVTLRNGITVVGTVRRSAGGPDTPMTDEALFQKFFGNVGSEAQPLRNKLMHLSQQPHIQHIFEDITHAVATNSK